MKAAVILVCVVATVVGQRQPLKEAVHLHDLTQPHLPRDPNVLHATHNFLNQFAELKALADAAPDPIPTHTSRPTAAPVFTPAPHRFSAPQPTPPAVQHFAPASPHFVTPAQPTTPTAQHFPAPQPSRTSSKDFDVHSEIRQLLSRHHTANPTTHVPHRPTTFTPTPVAVPSTSVPQQTFNQQRAPAFPTFSVVRTHQTRPQQPATMQVSQAVVRSFDPSVPITNQQGLVINPLQFPGPLAHSKPAGLTGRVEHTQFTPEVAAAHRSLANAHTNILRQQAAISNRNAGLF